MQLLYEYFYIVLAQIQQMMKKCVNDFSLCPLDRIGRGARASC